MHTKKLLCLTAVTQFLFGCAAYAEGPYLHQFSKNSQTSPKTETVEEIIKSNYLIGFSWIDSPLNSVVLVKSDEVMCAIKFISFNKGSDKKEPTTFNSGDESFFAEYEIVELKSGFISAKSQKSVSRLATIGIGRLSFQKGNTKVRCGETILQWAYPTSLIMSKDDKGVEFAFSRFIDLEQSLKENESATWYGYDEFRDWFLVPFTSL